MCYSNDIIRRIKGKNNSFTLYSYLHARHYININPSGVLSRQKEQNFKYGKKHKTLPTLSLMRLSKATTFHFRNNTITANVTF